MPTINIVSRWDSAKVLFTYEATEEQQAGGQAVRHALEAATKAGANLTDANLTDANLSGAYLRGANLTDANLSGAYLRGFRDDVWAVLSSAPAEAEAVLAALRAGKVDGSTYSGDCACLVGTIAKTRGCSTDQLGALEPDANRLAETWFTQIKPGNTPENHEPTRLAAEWVSQWIDAMRAAFGAQQAVQS